MRNKIVNNYKNNKIFGSILMIGIMILLVGFSYAFFVYNKTGLYTHTITGGKMSIIYNEITGNNITIANSYPLTDEEALTKGLEFEFTISGYNESDKNIYYAIEMDYGEDVSDKERFLDTDMKLTLYENDEEVFENEIFDNLDNQDIHYGMINYGTSSESPVTNNYKLRIWINDYVIISDTLSDDLSTWSENDAYWLRKNYPEVYNRVNFNESTSLGYYGMNIYTSEEFANRYANFKVNVKADLTYDDVGFITYDANGGEFTPEKTSLTTNMITVQKPVMENKGFLGWSSSKNAEEPEYLAGDYYSGDGKVLYAVYGDTINVMDAFSDTILEYAGEPSTPSIPTFNSDDYSLDMIATTENSVNDIITKIIFINDIQENIDVRYENATIKDDLTLNEQGNVKAWLEVDEESLTYILYIGAEGTIYLSDCVNMFTPFANCSYIDLNNVDTSKIKNMSKMFYIIREEIIDSSFKDEKYNSVLLSVPSYSKEFIIDNLTSLNTSNVTNMSGMFAESTTYELDVSKFDTSKVIDMSEMFCECKDLVSMDVSRFNTSSVKDMSNMFYNCMQITNLDVSKFDTSNVIDISGMFYNCNKILNLDVSDFNTSKITNMSEMFYRCNSLISLDVGNFDISNVTDMSYMFYECEDLWNLDVSKFDTSCVENMSCVFSGCSNLSKLDIDNWNTSNVIDMSYMFNGCSSVKILNVNNFKTSNVYNMSGMFWSCIGITLLDLSQWDTNQVNNISRMFSGCSNLISLNISNFDTTNITDTNYIFSGCIKLDTVYLNNALITKTIFNDADYLKKIIMRDATIVGNGKNVFSRLGALEEIDLTNTIFQDLTDMSNMFQNCYKLYKIDFSIFDTSKVTNMSSMFSGCSSLSSLDLSNFDTSKVTNMSSMFSGCSSLSSLNLSNFDTSKVTNMSSMFSGCSSLSSLNLSNFNFSNVSYMNSLFYNCSSLNDINLSNSLINKVITFSDAINLKSVILQNAKLSGDMSNLFSGCTSLTNINLNNIDASEVTNVSYMFRECNNIDNLDLSTFNIPLLHGSYLFYNCKNLKNLNLTNFKSKGGMYMFYGCESLISIDLSGFDTSDLGIMEGMFQNCKSLKNLDVSNFDTSKVTTMRDMFSGCESLTELDLSNFYSKSLYNISRMFSGCVNLISVDMSNFEIYQSVGTVKYGSSVFEGCSKLKIIYCNNEWALFSAESQNFFLGCTSLVGAVPYDSTKVDITMANPDTGYFTRKSS